MIERNALTVIDGDARITCRDVKLQLGFSTIAALHRLIQAHAAELKEYGSLDVKRVPVEAGQGGRPRNVFYLNEDQVSAIILWANTPKARELRGQFVRALVASEAPTLVKPGFFDLMVAVAHHRERASADDAVSADADEPLAQPRSKRRLQKFFSPPVFVPGHLAVLFIRAVQAALRPLVMAGPVLEKRLRPHVERLSDIPSPTRAERLRRAAILWLIGSPEIEPEPTEDDLRRCSASQDVARALSDRLQEIQRRPSADPAAREALTPTSGGIRGPEAPEDHENTFQGAR